MNASTIIDNFCIPLLEQQKTGIQDVRLEPGPSIDLLIRREHFNDKQLPLLSQVNNLAM